MRNARQRITLRRIASILTIPLLVAAPLGLSQPGNADPKITVSAQDKNVPSELNPPFASPQSGGAPNATPAQAAAFAWQEFIALNWPAMPQSGKQGQRDSPSNTCLFADANPAEYAHVALNSSPTDPTSHWWSQVPADVVTNPKQYLASHMASPPPGSASLVSLPNGTIEVKAAWRSLNYIEIQSKRFHMQTVRYYERGTSTEYCYRDNALTWGLVALHIIQKTPSAPYFIFATFEQADNILTASGQTVEDEDGNVLVNATAPTSPQECLVDPRPPLGPSS